jgi:hypothetical protein
MDLGFVLILGGLARGPVKCGPSDPRADKMTRGPGHGPKARLEPVGGPARVACSP